MTLYEIDAHIMECLSEDGEVINPEKMAELQMERADKIENVACWIKNLVAEAEMIEIERKKLDERKHSALKKAESLKGWLNYALEGQKFSTGKCAVSYRKSQVCTILDPEKVPAAWYKAKYEVDKASIKEALKNGEVVPGAVLEEKNNVVIR